ncbi:MAG: dihydroneopterin aldolase [Myxococcales bacterium]
MDRILIKDLLARCIIGANESERHDKQNVIVNLVLWTDLSKGGKSDRIADTLDYRSVRNAVMDMVESSKFFLIEALAERIAEVCLVEPKVHKVQVTVEKPSALRFGKSVGVEIERERPKSL